MQAQIKNKDRVLYYTASIIALTTAAAVALHSLGRLPHLRRVLKDPRGSMRQVIFGHPWTEDELKPDSVEQILNDPKTLEIIEKHPNSRAAQRYNELLAEYQRTQSK